MKKTFFTSFLFLLLTCHLAAYAQSFSPAFDTFSGSKTAYVNLLDGSKVEGTVEDLDRKKGLIEEITIKDGAGKKIKLQPAQIKDMYLPPSNYAKLNTGLDRATEVSSWSDDDINNQYINEGYAYFENSKVFVGKKEQVMMLQLLNPATSKGIKVYQDPLARETMGVGIAGIDVVGGEEKSYYVKVGDATAFRLFKKDYKSEFKNIFKDCKAVLDGVKSPDWSDFDKHVATYSKDCAK
jgi:hypothetical protein